MKDFYMSVNNLPVDFEVTDEFKDVFNLVETTSNSVHVTGKAGTGKSTLLRWCCMNSRKNIVVLAPTGIAAINVNGKTIHSFFHFPWTVLKKQDVPDSKHLRDVIPFADAVIIDEVSMVRADLMDAVDDALRWNMKQDKPFGGMQMLFFGDLFQLPPVVKGEKLNRYFDKEYGGSYFFNAKVFQQLEPKFIELTKVYRQKDPNYIELLDKTRYGKLSADDFAVLNSKVNTSIKEGGEGHIITLASTNAIADGINDRCLAKLSGQAHTYDAVIKGIYEVVNYPAPRSLKLKEGAQVMFLRNDKGGRWVNGTIGEVKDLSYDRVWVTVDDVTHEVSKETWEEFDYIFDSKSGKLDHEPMGSFTQFPLKLAWSITIHKSQGHSLDKVIIDLGNGAFAPGQTYVALSRCRTLEGMYLRRPIREKDVIFDRKVYDFLDEIRKNSI